MLDFGGEKHIRPLLLDGIGQIGTGTAADRHRSHLGGPRAGLQQPGRVQDLLKATKKLRSTLRLGIGADPPQSAGIRTTAAGWHQWT